jgi:hypothetical protein
LKWNGFPVCRRPYLCDGSGWIQKITFWLCLSVCLSLSTEYHWFLKRESLAEKLWLSLDHCSALGAAGSQRTTAGFLLIAAALWAAPPGSKGHFKMPAGKANISTPFWVSVGSELLTWRNDPRVLGRETNG